MRMLILRESHPLGPAENLQHLHNNKNFEGVTALLPTQFTREKQSTRY